MKVISDVLKVFTFLYCLNLAILYKFPDKEHPDVPFPTEVASFGLPMGAVIESWPLRASTSKSSPHLEFNTFVLNVNSNDGIIMEKVYGSCIIFYENFDQSKLNDEQLKLLELNGPEDKSRTLHSNKCLILLSRHPLFETYRNFLLFLYDKYTKKANSIVTMNNLIMPIERLTLPHSNSNYYYFFSFTFVVDKNNNYFNMNKI